jgi:FlaA1/EpsC-like NDP-sugar epimerase
MSKKYHLELIIIRLLSIAVDLLILFSVFAAGVLIKKVLDPQLPLQQYVRLWPFLILCWIVFEKTGLYDGTSIHSGSSLGPTEELRRLFYAISAVFIAVGFANFLYRPNKYLYSRTVLVGAYLCCLFLIPLGRFLFRKICTRLGYWGVPAVIIGSGETAGNIFNSMFRHPEYGLCPIGYFTNNGTAGMPEKAQYLGTLNDIPDKIKSLSIKYAILAKDVESDSQYIKNLIRQYGTLFPHLLFIPKSLLETCSGVTPKDIGGTLGLEIQHNLQNSPHLPT